MKTPCVAIALAVLTAFSGLADAAEAVPERIRIAVSVVNYPDAPDHAACRMKFRAVNESARRVELSALVHTFDQAQAGNGSWQVPTGMLEPGQVVERVYSCKQTSFVGLDQRNTHGWPGKCVVDGAFKAPCPVPVNVSFNLPELRPAR